MTAKWSPNRKSEKQLAREAELKRREEYRLAQLARDQPELLRLLSRFRVHGWVVIGFNEAGAQVLDESTDVSYWQLQPPRWAPVLVRGGLEELRRKAMCLR